MRSSMKVRKAMTSCLVVRSISSMRATSSASKSPARARQSASACGGREAGSHHALQRGELDVAPAAVAALPSDHRANISLRE